MKQTFIGVSCALLFLGASPLARAQDRVVVAGQDGVAAPKRTKTINPSYPQEALAQGVRGIVILEILIDPQGKVASADVIRSIPLLDEAALMAVRKWEYEVTKVGGQPVSVKLTVPITFALKLPEVTRAPGVPELRQGMSVAFPPGATEGASVTAEITLAPDGQVAEADVIKGAAPYTVALLQALRTWRFAPEDENVTLTLQVEAAFAAPSRSDKGHVDVRLGSPRRSESVGPSTKTADGAASPAPAPSAPAAEPGPAPAAPVAGEPTAPAATPPAADSPAPAPPTATSPAAPAPSAPAVVPPSSTPEPAKAAPVAPSEPQTPAPPSTAVPPAAPVSPPAQAPPPQAPVTSGQAGSPAPAAPATPAPATPPPASGPPTPAPSRPGTAATPNKPTVPATGPAAARPSTAPPPVEVLSAPTPPGAEANTAPPVQGVSAVKDVTLAIGVPDLVRGRRPVPPPLARMSGATGTVEVKFGVDAAGATSIGEIDGPDPLKTAAAYTVQSWLFRRITVERLHLVASFDFAGETAKVSIKSE
ncbi:MAG TPA: TonB family protein [Vicinamibacteria bacterium]|nr:TonB family protein [Vicinamibacteria bacterium]